jgi:2,4-dienoyl-CoA reductase (NADPH2)
LDVCLHVRISFLFLRSHHRIKFIGIFRGAFAFPTKKLKQKLNDSLQIPLVATNRINDPSTAEELLTDGTCDMISMARPFLADPELLQKSREGRQEEINSE